MEAPGYYRREIDQWIREGNLRKLLFEAAKLHGHLCPQLAQGIKAGYLGIKELNVKISGMESLMAIIEIYNGFSDGVQLVTGCSIGNNALILKDYGKTVVTVIKKEDGDGIRIWLSPEFIEVFRAEYPEANNLFKKIEILKEETNQEEKILLKTYTENIALDLLERDEREMFQWERKKVAIPDELPMYMTKRCSICGEDVMSHKVFNIDGTFLCIPCKDSHSL